MTHANIDMIQDELSNFRLLDHSFYKILWNQGLLSKSDLRYYAEQYYFIEENFLSCLKKAFKIWNNCVDFSKIVKENIADESGKGQLDKSHLQLWSEFALFCGTKKSELSSNPKNIEVQELLQETSELISKSKASAIGIFYAYELQIPEIAESKINGLVKHYGAKIHSKELDFFQEHKVADIWHVKQWNKLIEKFTKKEFEEFRHSSVKAAKLMLNFLDGIMRERSLTC